MIQKNPLKYRAHLDTNTATKILQGFIENVPASDLAQQLVIRKATILNWYMHFRKQLYRHMESNMPSTSSSRYLWLRRKQYPHYGRKNEPMHNIHIYINNHQLGANCITDIDTLPILPTRQIKQDLTNNYYVHHKKFVDEILPISTTKPQKTFFGTIPESVHAFVCFAKEMIHHAHGVPTEQLPLHVAERALKRQAQKKTSLLREILSTTSLPITE